MNHILLLFVLFIIYSFIGWTSEIVTCSISRKKLVKHRGFLLGPVIPIYGCGILIMTEVLKDFINHPVGLYFMCVLTCSILEYLTSYLMEKLFHARWWDYSNRFLNINGRVCFKNTALFGIAGILLMYYVHPHVYDFVSNLNNNILHIVAITLFILFTIDVTLSLIGIITLKKKAKKISNNKKKKDNTEEVSANIKQALIDDEKYVIRRLMDAYPSFEVIMYDIEKHKINKKRKNK